jgi:hypothetical protein
VPTNRTPIRRPATGQITARALGAFRRLVALESECIGPPDCEPYRRCSTCEQWWVEQRTIHSELHLRPWEMAVEYEGMAEWEPDPAAVSRWRLFEEAAREPESRFRHVAKPDKPKRRRCKRESAAETAESETQNF